MKPLGVALFALTCASCGLLVGDYEIGDAGADHSSAGDDANSSDDASGGDSGAVETGGDAGPTTVDLTPTTGMPGNEVTQTVAYLVRFNAAVTIIAIEFHAAPGAVGDQWVTHVWDVGSGSVLATGSTAFAPSATEGWFHSNIAFSAARNTQYVLGVHKVSGYALYAPRPYNVALPFTVANLTVLEWCSANNAADISPTCDNTAAFGFAMRVVEQ